MAAQYDILDTSSCLTAFDHEPFEDEGDAIGGAYPPGVCIGVVDVDAEGDRGLPSLCLRVSKYSRLILRDAMGPPGDGDTEEMRVRPLGGSSGSVIVLVSM